MEAYRTKVDGFEASVHELGVVVEGEVLQVVEPPKKTNTSHMARADSNTNCCGSETAICDVEERSGGSDYQSRSKPLVSLTITTVPSTLTYTYSQTEPRPIEGFHHAY